MEATRVITKKISELLASKLKYEAIVSLPVIRFVDDMHYIALFISEKTGENKMNRPSMYCLLDVETGGLKKVNKCTEKDFSSETADKTYELNTEAENRSGIGSKENALAELGARLDSVRQAIIEGAERSFILSEYSAYMDTLHGLIPSSCHLLYDDLSLVNYAVFKESEKQPGEEFCEAEESAEKDNDEEKDKEEGLDETTVLEQREFSIDDVDWKPIGNLSTLPERPFNMMCKIADSIEFLPCNEPDRIKYSYPLFCFWEDVSAGADKWGDLLSRLELAQTNPDAIASGHFKIRPGKTIYSTCKNGEGRCIFGKCPYMVAAYIKYLKERNPERLKDERRAYFKKRFAIDSRFSEPISYTIGIPEEMDKELLSQGLKDSDAGRIRCVQISDGLYGVEFFRESEDGGRSERYRIDKNEMLKPVTDHIAVTGKKIDEAVTYALIADYMDRTGLYEKALNQKKWDLTPYLTEKSRALQCVTSKWTRAYYGVVYSNAEMPKDSQAVKELEKSLRDKGVDRLIQLKAETISDAESVFAEKDALYAIYDIDKIHESGTFNENISHFVADRYVILFGSRGNLTKLLKDQSLKRIFGMCALEDSGTKGADFIGTLYEKILEKLPLPIREREPKSFKDTLEDWYIKNRDVMPVPEGELADFIAWQFTVENPYRLRDYSGKKGGN